jgi:hypothetical protein
MITQIDHGIVDAFLFLPFIFSLPRLQRKRPSGYFCCRRKESVDSDPGLTGYYYTVQPAPELQMLKLTCPKHVAK